MVANVVPQATRSLDFNGVKVFAATLVRDRHQLGEKVTAWLEAHPMFEVADIIVTQSSDAQFHCIAISIFYSEPVTRPNR
jgi:hypothetical protein